MIELRSYPCKLKFLENICSVISYYRFIPYQNRLFQPVVNATYCKGSCIPNLFISTDQIEFTL